MAGLAGNIADLNVLVYFVYGLAFFSLGLVTWLQSRAMPDLRPIRQLWLLSLFGLLHGASEWIELGTLLGWLDQESVVPFNIVLRVASFAFLLQFGTEFLLALGGRPRSLRLFSLIMLVVWLVVVVMIQLVLVQNETRLAAMDAAMRYVLAFPGSLLAAYALRRGSFASGTLDAPSSFFTGAAIALAAYAIVGGLVVPAAPFFPASVINQDVFASNIGVPVVVARTLCAVAASGFLAEAFVVEVSRSQVRMVGLLRQMDQMREEFISVVAHDLRSPVAVITGYADLLRGLPTGAHGSELEHQAVDGIGKSARHLERMVGDLLDASRIDAKRLTLQKEWVDLPRLVSEAAAQIKVTTGHEVRVQVENDIPKLRADPQRLHQIMTNLLSNAAKYSAPGTPSAVSIKARLGEVEVSVVNVGVGIAPEERERIFSRFHRTREAAQSKVSGLGLGLYITRGLVEAHGGRIWVESRQAERAGEEQTAFRFLLPIETD